MSKASDKSTKRIAAFPKGVWLFWFCIAWLTFGVLPQILVAIGRNGYSVFDAETVSAAGTVGDAFGLANSLFSGAALLFVIWSIRLQHESMMLQPRRTSQHERGT